MFGFRPTCSPGCPERFREVFFSRDSILWWCLTHHRISRQKGQARLIEFGIENGTNEPRRMMRRLGGWGSELKRWFKEVEDMVSAKQKVV